MYTLVGLGLSLVLAASADAGPLNGNFRAKGTVAPRSVRSYSIYCKANEATIFDGLTDFTDMNVIVLDERGQRICGTAGSGSKCVVTWTSPTAERVLVLVVNRSDETRTFKISIR